jgi:hypothetical protein
MATSQEYALVAAKLTAELLADEAKFVPAMFRGMIPKDAIPNLATACAKTAVDTLDAFRAQENKP